MLTIRVRPPKKNSQTYTERGRLAKWGARAFKARAIFWPPFSVSGPGLGALDQAGTAEGTSSTATHGYGVPFRAPKQRRVSNFHFFFK